LSVPIRLSPTLIFVSSTLAGVLAGAVCWFVGWNTAADAFWFATAALAFIPALLDVLRALRKGSPGVDLIALLAILAALLLQEFLAGAVIGLMLATGQALEDYAENRADRELSALLKRAPRFARRIAGADLEEVPLDQVSPGDILAVSGGEVVPVDGLVLEAQAVLDESALTGESRLVERQMYDAVRSGTVNAGSAFRLKATSSAANSTYAGIIRMVEAAKKSKAPMQRLADRYAIWFVPTTLIVSGLAWALSGSAERALAVLVVATPCPLLLATPIAIVSGVSRAARRGIVVKGGAALETLARAQSLFLDKTGTLTRGSPELQRIVVTEPEIEQDDVLAAAASLEQLSSHVFAAAVVRAARQRSLPLSVPLNVLEAAGAGVEGDVDGRHVRLGNFEWAANEPPKSTEEHLRRRLARGQGSVVYVSVDGSLAGALVFDDPIRPDAPRTIRMLKSLGIGNIVMLTGDRAGVAESVGAALGVDHVLSELAPDDKVRAVIAAKEHGVTLMVGDGINDAPALASADVGIAMGARGATSSSEAADAVLVVDRLDRLVEALGIARDTRAIAVQSIVIGMALSFIAMGFAAAGALSPVWGAFLQEGIDAIAILSALRALGGSPVAEQRFQLPAGMAAKLRKEHQELRPVIDRLRIFAGQLAAPGSALLPSTIADVRATLATIMSHERNDEAEVYRTISSGLKGDDPLAGMSRTHQEIFHLGDILERLLTGLEDDPTDLDDLVDLRRVLYSIDVILRLNIAQEEELYFSLDRDYSGSVAA